MNNRADACLRVAFGGSLILNATLIKKLRDAKRYNDDILKGASRIELIDTLYKIRTNENYENKKEINTMKIKNTSIRTKILGGITIALSAATTLSIINDYKVTKPADAVEDVAEELTDTLSDAIDASEDLIESVVD